MAELKKIDKDIQRKFFIGFLVLIIIFTFFVLAFMAEQRRTIDEHHVGYIGRADDTIAILLGQARLNSYITAKEITELLIEIEAGKIEKEVLLNHLAQVELREEANGILLAQHVLLTVNTEGYVLARSEWIRGERVPLFQKGHIRDGWTPCLAFEQAFAHALGDIDAGIEPRSDVRKIIYDMDFMRREGYGFLKPAGMGLTVMTPIINKEANEQIGVLISVTFLNLNPPVFLGINAITDVSFTAILPSGEVIGSIFKSDSVEKIKPSPELIAAAKERAVEKGDLIRKGIKVPGKDFILEEFTIERIGLTHADVAGGTTHYYRVVYWLELDYQGNFASLRGIAMETDLYVAQQAFLAYLIGGIIVFLLVTFGLFYFFIQKRLIQPIISFTAQLRTQEEGKKIEILKSYQEFQELENAFNHFFNQIKEAKNILEVKVESRTRQLTELSESLEEQVRKKTEDLQARIDELERFKNVTVGREIKMIELKKEIERLKEKIEKSKT